MQAIAVISGKCAIFAREEAVIWLCQAIPSYNPQEY